MITDTEIKAKGIHILAQHLGDVEAERFIALIQREPFDYTKWHQEVDKENSVQEISRNAMSLRLNSTEDDSWLCPHRPPSPPCPQS